MNEIAIIIPSRLAAERLPNKPLELINNKEMILHVYDAAKYADIGDVYVATPDEKIVNVVMEHGGKAIITQSSHQTGTDRVFEVFNKHLKKKPKIIINLQGDMPNISSKDIRFLADHMKKNLCDIGTLAGDIRNKKEEKDPNVVKVKLEKKINKNFFSKAIDFFRTIEKAINDKTYHHIGIYAFTNKALMRYVDLERTKLELKKKLEQLRALENNMKIDVGFVKYCPLSVDTENDLIEVKKIMKNLK